jgi:transcriptional regulator with XRE-family HTH domain
VAIEVGNSASHFVVECARLGNIYVRGITIVMPAQAKNSKSGGRLAANLILLMNAAGVTQEILAEDLGLSQSSISNYLGGRTPKTDILFTIANYFRVTAPDLIHKDMRMEPGMREIAESPVDVRRHRTLYDRLWERFESFPDSEAERWAKVFLKILDELKDSEKELLTPLDALVRLPEVKAPLENLLRRANRLTQEPGKKSELARFLNVPLASLSRWLSGKREPGGEATLQLLHWVEQQER